MDIVDKIAICVAVLLTLCLMVVLVLFHEPPHVTKLCVTAEELYNDYKRNADKADRKYRDKQFHLNGKIQEITSNYTVYLYAAPKTEGVTCVPDSEEFEKISKFRVGQSVSLLCTGIGLTFSMPIVNHCQVK